MTNLKVFHSPEFGKLEVTPNSFKEARSAYPLSPTKEPAVDAHTASQKLRSTEDIDAPMGA